ncbi:STAS domain-containing protein [Shewanella surugensis]|uniref:STAS domain-containing protein n=1 Tax=Shewanella surugensis TaxID=212020 RepID=A0ABT0LD44_9GAMM|nr:STAS domain-containing protein [Shewanella surugensis]MCL1125627.1 STAS domain-containing protein [Shewanella surugensis]
MATFTQKDKVCHISGQLGQSDVIDLWPKKESLLAPDTQVLELSLLEFSDSAGVAFLFELASLVANKGQKLVLKAPANQLRKLIQLYDLKDFFVKEVI